MWDKKRAIAFGRKAGGKMRKDITVGECCDGSLSHPLTTPIVSCNGEKQPSPDWLGKISCKNCNFASCYHFSPTSCITDHQQRPPKNLYMMSSQPLRPTKACKKKRHFLLAFVFNWFLVNYYHFFNTRMKDRELRPLEDVLCILVHGGWMEVSQYHVQLVMLNTSLTSVESLMWRSSIWKVMVILRINHVFRLCFEMSNTWISS